MTGVKYACACGMKSNYKYILLLSAPPPPSLGPKSLGGLRHTLALHVQLQQSGKRQARDSEQTSPRRGCHSFGNVVGDHLQRLGKTPSATDRQRKAAHCILTKLRPMWECTGSATPSAKSMGRTPPGMTIAAGTKPAGVSCVVQH